MSPIAEFLLGIYLTGTVTAFLCVGFLCVLGGKESELWKPFIYAPLWFILIPLEIFKKWRSKYPINSLIYVEPDSNKNITDNFFRIFKYLDEKFKWYSIIGDDDGINLNVISAIKYAEEVGIQSKIDRIYSSLAFYNYSNHPDPFLGSRGIFINRKSIGLTSNKKFLRDYLNLYRGTTFHMPGLYMGIIHIDVMKEIGIIINKKRDLFEITAPDVFLTFMTLIYQKKDFSLMWNTPLFVRGASGDSNGARIHTDKVYKPILTNIINNQSLLTIKGNTYISHILTIWFEYIQAIKTYEDKESNIYSSVIKRRLTLAVTFELSKKIKGESVFKIYQLLTLPFKKHFNKIKFYFYYYNFMLRWIYERLSYHVSILFQSKNKISYLICRFIKPKKYSSMDEFMKGLNFEK
jgi:hypothetical protein